MLRQELKTSFGQQIFQAKTPERLAEMFELKDYFESHWPQQNDTQTPAQEYKDGYILGTSADPLPQSNSASDRKELENLSTDSISVHKRQKLE